MRIFYRENPRILCIGKPTVGKPTHKMHACLRGTKIGAMWIVAHECNAVDQRFHFGGQIGTPTRS